MVLKHILIFLFSLFSSCQSNIKLNELFIKSILTNFYSEIKDILEFSKFDDLFLNETILFTIPEFTINKIYISIKDNDIITFKLKDVVPSLRKEIFRDRKIVVVRNLIVLLNDFELEINIKIKKRFNFDDQNSPEFELLGNPIINYNPEVLSNYNEMREKFSVMIENGDFRKIYIIPIINEIIDKIITTIDENYQSKILINNNF